MDRQTVVTYLAEMRLVHTRQNNVLSTGLAPHDPEDPEAVTILVQFTHKRRVLAPVELAVVLATDLRVEVESHDEQEAIVRYTLRPRRSPLPPAPEPFAISTEKPRAIPVRTSQPLTGGPARVLVAQSDLQRLVKLLRTVKGVRKSTPLMISADRPGIVSFTSETIGMGLDCAGTWATPLTLSLKYFRELAPAIPPDDPISLEAVEGNLVIAGRLTIYRLTK